MSKDQADIRALLEAHPRRDDLARLLRTVALSAADERRARFSDGLDELLREAALEPEDGVVGSLNVLRVLSSNQPPTDKGRGILGSLLLRGVRIHIDGQDTEPDDEAWQRITTCICWLAANTHIDGVLSVDDELDRQQATRVWSEMAALARGVDAAGADKGRALALVAATALASSGSEAARGVREALRPQLRDPLLRAAFAPLPSGSGAASGAEIAPVVGVARVTATAAEPAADAAGEVATSTKRTPEDKPKQAALLSGELVPPPLGPLGLVLWTATGLILVRYLLRFIADVLLRRRRPVEITVASAGVTFKSKLDILGKTIRTRETHIPLSNLAHAVREVRYPRLALYGGLTALALGTYLGVALVTDGVQAGSPSLLGLGAGVFAAGVVIDMLFSTLIPGRAGTHRVIFVPRKGRAYAVRVRDEGAADKALRTLASR